MVSFHFTIGSIFQLIKPLGSNFPSMGISPQHKCIVLTSFKKICSISYFLHNPFRKACKIIILILQNKNFRLHLGSFLESLVNNVVGLLDASPCFKLWLARLVRN